MRTGIIGGAGYIGAHVVQDLLEEGHELLVLDDLSTGNPENLVEDNPRYTFIKGDFGQLPALEKLFEFRPDVIFHFAALKSVEESMENPERYSALNLRNTFQLLEAMGHHGCRHIIFSSSAAIYGDPQYLPVDESHPLRPKNYYGFTKKIIEENLGWYSRLRNIRHASLRYFNACGYDLRGRVWGLEKNPRNLLPLLIEVATGRRSHIELFGTDYDTPDGTCIRDYIHVNDLSRAHLLAMRWICEKDRDLVVNLGSERQYSVRHMIEEARRITGREIPCIETGRRAGDPAILVADSRKARETLGWRAEFSDSRTLIESAWKIFRHREAEHS